jgi:hypothetical protein
MTSLDLRPRTFVQTAGLLLEERPRGPAPLRARLTAGASSLSFPVLTPAQEVCRGLEMILGSFRTPDANG